MRLIDADELIEEYTQIFVEKYGIEGGEMFKGVIKQMPTVYDVDKVIEQLEQDITEAKGTPYFYGQIIGLSDAIEIVKGGINGLD